MSGLVVEILANARLLNEYNEGEAGFSIIVSFFALPMVGYTFIASITKLSEAISLTRIE